MDSRGIAEVVMSEHRLTCWQYHLDCAKAEIMRLVEANHRITFAGEGLDAEIANAQLAERMALEIAKVAHERYERLIAQFTELAEYFEMSGVPIPAARIRSILKEMS